MEGWALRKKLETDLGKAGTLILTDGTSVGAGLFDINENECIFILSHPKIEGQLPIQIANELKGKGLKTDAILSHEKIKDRILKLHISELKTFIVPVSYEINKATG